MVIFEKNGMNFLAHQYLSFQQEHLQIGNLFGEIVRGKDYLDFSEGLQKGILLHRHIDTFTDAHPMVKESSKKFHQHYGKYAPVIVDVVYDYFLIKNWSKYSEQAFEEFVSSCYDLFRKHFDDFPSPLQLIIDHLLKYDWFHNYTHIDGIKKTLDGISQRSKFKNYMGQADREIILYENELNEEFNAFFPDIIQSCSDFLNS